MTPDMESYYVYDIFLPLFLTSLAAVPLCFTAVDLLSGEKRYGRGAGIFLFLLFLIGRALIPACPFPAAGLLLSVSSLLVLPPMILLLLPEEGSRRYWASWILPAGASLLAAGRILLSYPATVPLILASALLVRVCRRIETKRDPSWRHHQSWIIGSVREAIMILDVNMNIISGGEGIFPSPLITPGRGIFSLWEIPAKGDSDLAALKKALEGRGEPRGVMAFAGRSYAFRFTVLEGKCGYLLTFLDITEEQELLGELRDKHRMLTNRRIILQSEEEGDLTFHRKKEEIREQISRKIQNLVEAELTLLREKLEKQDLSDENIAELQGHAEQSMAHIRRAVSKLRGERNENKHRTGGGSATHKGLTGAPSLGRG